MRAAAIVEQLHRHGVTHVVGLPDNGTRALFERLWDDADIDVVPVTREGEAFAAAAGLYLGGREPIVIMQNTGFSGNRRRLPWYGLQHGYPPGRPSGVPRLPLHEPQRRHRHGRLLPGARSAGEVTGNQPVPRPALPIRERAARLRRALVTNRD